jgi:hypothetical protein
MSTTEHEDDFVVRQNPDVVDRRKITAVTVVSLAVIVVAVMVSWALLERWRTTPATPPPPPRPPPATIAMLEQSLILDTRRGQVMREEQRAALQRFGWADRDAGVATIPIEIAIDMYIQRPPPLDRGVSPGAPTTTGAVHSPPPQRKERR